MTPLKRILPCLMAVTLLTVTANLNPCTSLVLEAGKTLVFGTNFDNDIWWGLVFVNQRNVEKTGWEAGTTGRVAAWISKYGSLTINSAGYQLPWAGMNEAGLVISTMALQETKNPDPDERPPLRSSFWIQYVLDTCATVDEVIATEKTVRISGTWDHYLVCDRNGTSAAVEFLDGRMVVHSKDGFPVRALANRPYAVCAERLAAGKPEGLHPYDSVARMSRVADRLKAFDGETSGSAVDYAFGILEDVSAENTQWSLVFDIPNAVFHFRTSRNAQHRFIDLKKLDFGCGAAVRMLDAHRAGLSGDISAAFIDYSTAASEEHLLRALELYKVDVPPDQARQLLRMMERFPCKK